MKGEILNLLIFNTLPKSGGYRQCVNRFLNFDKSTLVHKLCTKGEVLPEDLQEMLAIIQLESGWDKIYLSLPSKAHEEALAEVLIGNNIPFLQEK